MTYDLTKFGLGDMLKCSLSQSFARGILGEAEPRPTMECLTLMATVGQSAAWNSRHLSRGHRAIPLPSPEIVEKAPMTSQLIKELGVELKVVFAVLFSTVHVPAASADRFRTLALDVKSAFSRFTDANVFNQSIISSVGTARTH